MISILPALVRSAAAALDVLLPPHCPCCDTIVASDGSFCARCFARATFIVDPFCARCALPFAHAGEGGALRICLRCEDAPPPWQHAASALVYDDFARRLILPLKYADRTENARPLGAMMARAGADLLARADLVIPVPLHRLRLLQRRYNQAALLARAVRAASGRRAPSLLVDGLERRRPTRSLATQSARARRAELDGAIAVRRGAPIPGRRVLLVDDVLTTGSTASACALALRAAGAEEVSLLVAARTPAPADAG